MFFAGCLLSVRLADENEPRLHRLVLSPTTSSAKHAGTVSFDGCFKNVSFTLPTRKQTLLEETFVKLEKCSINSTVSTVKWRKF